MASDQECVDYARECVRLAGLTNDAQLRQYLTNLARDWIATSVMHKNEMLEATSRLR